MAPKRAGSIRLFLCGDVMTGRGIDQVLPHPGNPVLYESHVRDAREYVRLAELINGPIARPVDFESIWGDAPGKGRVLVFSLGSPSAGIPVEWRATEDRPGVNLLEDLSDEAARQVAGQV